MPSLPRSASVASTLSMSALHALLIVGLAFGDYAYPAAAAAAEEPAQPAPAVEAPSAADLERLVGPIALYPDELLAIVLPASTYPLQIVQAARLLERREKEPDLKPDESWDASIIGLMNYPEVIQLMNEDLDWTWKLGEAVANQQPDVMDAVQSFRGKVDAAGNLESNDKVKISREAEESKEAGEAAASQQIIVIESASPEVIYVPTYQPSTVIVHHTAPYPYYYSRPYPYYYSPAAAFWTGMFVGAAVGWGLSWGRHGYHRSSVKINNNVNINVNRPTRPSTPNRPGGGGGNWKADKARGKQSGARPGGGSRPSAGGRPAAGGGSRPSAGSRPAAGGGSRPSAGTRPSSGGTARSSGSKANRSSGSKANRSSGRNLTSPGGSKRSSRGSSVGHYGSGSKSRANASRGSSSRSNRSGASRGGRSGGGRSGGGRGRGGGGGRR